MDYQQTLEWLFQQLPMYQRVGKSAYKADLSATEQMDKYLGHPHQHFPSIHVAGTNGKGSTCHILASILMEAGYTVGLYTSPHLIDFRERIKINGKKVEKKYVTHFVKLHREYFERNQHSFFEMTVGMAFSYFAERQVDIAIIETGMGGRLDSTNIITPLVSVITSIGKDHTAFLGNTLTKIAEEKAGIIKSGKPVVIGERRALLRSRFRESANAKNAPCTIVNHRKAPRQTDLLGNYQRFNVRTAVQSIEVLQKHSRFKITNDQIEEGCRKVIENTGLLGRYQVLADTPKTVADVAHNPAGIQAVLQQVMAEEYAELHVVMGVVNDKDVAALMDYLPKTAQFYLSRPDVPRGMPVEQLADYFKSGGRSFQTYDTVRNAYTAARETAGEQDFILVTGSVFTVAEVLDNEQEEN